VTRALLALVLLFAQQGKPIPPTGVPLPEADRAELEAGLKQLRDAIEPLRKTHTIQLPNVEIFYKAVHVALRHNEFLNAKEIPVGKDLIKAGLKRAEELSHGNVSWEHATGLVPRAYV